MKTILVVDDVPEVTDLLKLMIERTQRYTVTTSNSGKEALQLAEELRPHLVVCDIDMPGMAGSDVAARMAENRRTKGIPIIFLSSLVTPRDMYDGADSGHRPMISKEAPIEVLIKTIDRMLED